jgi:hypothetical protein
VLYKPEVKNYVRGQEILDKYPGAEFVEIPSHWKIPELHGFHGVCCRLDQDKKQI